ncbi:hypothetical protein ABPG75_003815 [Micractinium tetrahymenae]
MLKACLLFSPGGLGLAASAVRRPPTAPDPSLGASFHPFSLPPAPTLVPGHDGRAIRLLAGGQRQQSRRRCKQWAVPPRAADAAVPSPEPLAADGTAPAGGQHKAHQGRLAALLHPFSDPAANSKLLALCSAQAMSSVSTLLTETYLPVYLSDVLHLSHTKIGALQGSAQLLSKASGSLSGTLADLLSPARVLLVGAALSFANKPMYAAAGWVAATAGATACAYWILFAKLFDRLAKGIREAPSKALMGQLASAGGDAPAAAFALRQSVATLGALGGALAASAALRASGYNYTLVFGLACVPAAAALALLATAFGSWGGPGGKAAGEDGSEAEAGDAGLGLADKARLLLGALRPAYWQALAVVALLYFARFDAGFATLRAKTVMDRSKLPYLIPCMMVTQAVLAAPMGVRAKASVASRNRVLLQGMACMIAADACFALWPSAAGMVVGAFLLGIHMAMTHGVSLGMLAAHIPSHALPGLGPVGGTCWSLTDLLLGVVLAASNWLAGRLSDATAARGLGSIGCFGGGATATALSMAALLLFSMFGDLGKEELVQKKGPPPDQHGRRLKGLLDGLAGGSTSSGGLLGTGLLDGLNVCGALGGLTACDASNGDFTVPGKLTITDGTRKIVIDPTTLSITTQRPAAEHWRRGQPPHPDDRRLQGPRRRQPGKHAHRRHHHPEQGRVCQRRPDGTRQRQRC